MYFPLNFSQQVVSSALAPALSAPTGAPSAGTTGGAINQLAYVGRDINGWPVHRIAVVYVKGTSSAPATIAADLYFYEGNSQTWVKANASTVTLTNGVVAYYDVPTTFSQPINTATVATAQANVNNVIALVPIDPGGLTASAVLTFVAAPDLTTFS
jgi:hypothetical protein